MASVVRRFFSAKVNLALTILFTLLLVAFAFILGFVTIPGFRHGSSRTSASSATHYAAIRENFPDPTIMWNWDDSTWYAFASRNDDVNVQVATAHNISAWTLLPSVDALPDPGRWTAQHVNDTQVWGPSVTTSYSGEFVMYYSALSRNQTRKHCISAAKSFDIMGPYLPLDKAILCDFSHGGVIDPAYFHDPGTNVSYLIYKQDGNAIGVGGSCDNGNWPNSPTPIYAVELSVDDLVTPVGEPFVLLTNIRSDGPNVESPLVYYYEYQTNWSESGIISSYHLLFNSGCYHDRSYHINHIICIPGNSFTSSGIRSCDWSAARALPGLSSGFAQTLLTSYTTVSIGSNAISVASPGGPAIGTSNQGGAGDGNMNKQYMAFHADTNLKWYENENIETRVRSMFIAELEYWGQESMVKVKGLVEPAARPNLGKPKL